MNWDMTVKWKLDPVAGLASPDSPHEHLKYFSVPIKPMLGCVGLAPEGNDISTEDAGPFGGNLDFSLITKGAIVYLPVFHPGGLLFMGDAHAMQGDGELNMAALEVSMDFEFTTEIIPHNQMQLAYPRIEDSTYIMTVGLAEHLDDAFKIANTGMLRFLQNECDLSDVEAAQVMGTSLEYQIPEITDPQVEVVAKIKKSRLSLLYKLKGKRKNGITSPIKGGILDSLSSFTLPRSASAAIRTLAWLLRTAIFVTSAPNVTCYFGNHLR